MLDGITGFDHAMILVSDLGQAAAQYRRLGFTLTDRGEHPAFGTANHTIMLEGNYLELLTIERITPASAARAEALRRGEGPHAVALATEDGAAVHRALAAQGVASEPPADFVRPVRLAGTTRDARFRRVGFPPCPALPNLFACQHFTRDLVWRPEWMAHPNGALRITELILSHPDPATLREDYAHLLGGESIEPTVEGWRLALGDVWLSASPPAALAHRFDDVTPPGASCPAFVDIALAVRSLAELAAHLRAGAVPHRALAEGIVVPPAAAHGALLLFHEGIGSPP